MLSYCGSGYKGMQLNPPHKSIEGDLFEAFVKAGAISQANSNDPKKVWELVTVLWVELTRLESSLVRCARTDKGVHAAGNVISLKLIIEDPELVQKINANLPEQIRVWDVIRTTGSFSSYQICDSRKYEYLLPSHVFLPPHPKSYLAKKCREYAEKEGDLENYLARQKEVEGWWEQTNKKVNNVLEQEGWYKGKEDRTTIDKALEEVSESEDPWKEEKEAKKAGGNQEEPLLRRIREIHAQEKRAYHIPSERLERVRTAFQQYVGTNNFYNFTIDKTFKDPSAKRHIKSFEVCVVPGAARAMVLITHPGQ
jgi:tRNA pseudouridine38-40 synthase